LASHRPVEASRRTLDMTEAIFGLLGVVIGGLIQGGANWSAERRREDWAARRAGRLLAPAFGRCQFILDAASNREVEWGFIADEVGASLDEWPEHAAVLAGTVTQDDWNTVLRAVSACQRVRQRGEATRSAVVDEADRPFLGEVAEVMWQGAFTCSFIGTVGVRQHRLQMLRRRLAIRLRGKARLDQEAEDVVRYSYEVQGAEPPVEDRPESG
jgi:hypothetical protein